MQLVRLYIAEDVSDRLARIAGQSFVDHALAPLTGRKVEEVQMSRRAASMFRLRTASTAMCLPGCLLAII
jgi:hypothetical protein